MSRRRRYQWGDWLKKKSFTLRRGEDYQCSTETMVQQVRNAASFNGVWVDMEVVKGPRRADKIRVKVRESA
jgi:hypothetical protein